MEIFLIYITGVVLSLLLNIFFIIHLFKWEWKDLFNNESFKDLFFICLLSWIDFLATLIVVFRIYNDKEFRDEFDI